MKTLFALLAASVVTACGGSSGGSDLFCGSSTNNPTSSNTPPATNTPTDTPTDTSTAASNAPYAAADNLGSSVLAGVPQALPVTVTVQNPGDQHQLAVKAALEGVLSHYDVSKYLFKREVQIITGGSSNSGDGAGPIQLSPRTGTDPDSLLILFLHEESHNSSPDKEQAWQTVIQTMRRNYPNLPKTPATGGAFSEQPSYVHVPVNWLELQAAKRFLGEDRAYQLICNQAVYAGIYKHVVENEQAIAQIMVQNGLNIEPYVQGAARRCY